MDGRVYNGAGVGGGQSRTTVQLHGRGFVYLCEEAEELADDYQLARKTRTVDLNRKSGEKKQSSGSTAWWFPCGGVARPTEVQERRPLILLERQSSR